jgi:hypothetical protein
VTDTPGIPPSKHRVDSYSDLSLDGVERGTWTTDRLPLGWAWFPFDRVFRDVTHSTRKLPTKDYKAEGAFPIVDQGEIAIPGYTDREDMLQPAPPPYVVFGDHTRCVKFVETPFVQGADGVKVLVPRGNIAPAYAASLVKTIDLPDKGYSRHMKFLRASYFPVCPLREQRRIVAKLDALTARTASARAELDRVPALAARYKQEVLAAAFRGDLTADWRSSNGRPSPRRERLGAVAKDFAYGSSTKSQPFGAVPVLRMGNIQDGRLRWDDLTFTSDPSEIRKYTLSAGDVLFNRTNSPALVGKTALFQGERDAIFAGYLIRVRCTKRLRPDYLTHALNSPVGRDYCWSVKTDGVSQSNINTKKLAEFTFLLPEPDEQAEVVRLIDVGLIEIDRLAAEAAAARRLLDRLDQAILAKAFRGELVPQDPADEPASVLLDRIRTERAGRAPTRRGRSTRAA